MRTAEEIVRLGTRPDYRNGEPIPGSRSPTGYLALTPYVKHYQCCDRDNVPSCPIRHRSPLAMARCGNGTRTAARVEDGKLVAVSIRRIGASNGEGAVLPYPLYIIDEEANGE